MHQAEIQAFAAKTMEVLSGGDATPLTQQPSILGAVATGDWSEARSRVDSDYGEVFFGALAAMSGQGELAEQLFSVRVTSQPHVEAIGAQGFARVATALAAALGTPAAKELQRWAFAFPQPLCDRNLFFAAARAGDANPEDGIRQPETAVDLFFLTAQSGATGAGLDDAEALVADPGWMRDHGLYIRRRGNRAVQLAALGFAEGATRLAWDADQLARVGLMLMRQNAPLPPLSEQVPLKSRVSFLAATKQVPELKKALKEDKSGEHRLRVAVLLGAAGVRSEHILFRLDDKHEEQLLLSDLVTGELDPADADRALLQLRALPQSAEGLWPWLRVARTAEQRGNLALAREVLNLAPVNGPEAFFFWPPDVLRTTEGVGSKIFPTWIRGLDVLDPVHRLQLLVHLASEETDKELRDAAEAICAEEEPSVVLDGIQAALELELGHFGAVERLFGDGAGLTDLQRAKDKAGVSIGDHTDLLRRLGRALSDLDDQEQSRRLGWVASCLSRSGLGLPPWIFVASGLLEKETSARHLAQAFRLADAGLATPL